MTYNKLNQKHHCPAFQPNMLGQEQWECWERHSPRKTPLPLSQLWYGKDSQVSSEGYANIHYNYIFRYLDMQKGLNLILQTYNPIELNKTTRTNLKDLPYGPDIPTCLQTRCLKAEVTFLHCGIITQDTDHYSYAQFIRMKTSKSKPRTAQTANAEPDVVMLFYCLHPLDGESLLVTAQKKSCKYLNSKNFQN